MQTDLFIVTCDMAEDLQKEFKSLTEYEALKIASHIIFNEKIATGLGVFSSDDAPHYLEGLAINVGELSGAIYEIANQLFKK